MVINTTHNARKISILISKIQKETGKGLSPYPDPIPMGRETPTLQTPSPRFIVLYVVCVNSVNIVTYQSFNAALSAFVARLTEADMGVEWLSEQQTLKLLKPS